MYEGYVIVRDPDDIKTGDHMMYVGPDRTYEYTVVEWDGKDSLRILYQRTHKQVRRMKLNGMTEHIKRGIILKRIKEI